MFFFVFCFFLNLFGQNFAQYPYVFKQSGVRGEVRSFHVSDLNYDYKDEFILKVTQPGAVCAIRVYAHDLYTIYYQKNFNKDIININSLDWDQKGNKEILLVEKDSRWINLLLLNAKDEQDTLAFMPLIFLEQYGRNAGVCCPRYRDINRDGYKEIIIAITSGLNPKLRAVWAVDLKNKQVIWKYDLASNVRGMELVQTSQKDSPYLLISTQSPDNGYKVNKMSDAYSYAIVLQANSGKPLLEIKMGGPGASYTEINWFNEPGDLIIGVWNQSFKASKKNKIYLYDFISGSIKRQVPNLNNQERLHIADVNNDNKNELIRSGMGANILVYDNNLNPIDNLQLPPGKNMVSKIFDWDKDGFLEYFVLHDNSNIFIIDRFGKILAGTDYCGEIFPIGKGVVNDDGIGIFNQKEKTLKIFTIQRNRIIGRYEPQSLLAGLLIGIVLSALIFLLIYQGFRRKSWLVKNISTLENLPIALIIADKKGMTAFCNHEMEQLLVINKINILDQPLNKILTALKIDYDLNKLQNDDYLSERKFNSEIEAGGAVKKIAVRLYCLRDKDKKTGFLLTAADVTQTTHYKQSIAWASMAQRLAHEIKNPLTTVKLSLQRLKMEYENENEINKSKYDKYVDSSLEEVIRLRNAAENFMKLFQSDNPIYKKINLDESITNVVSKYKPAVPENISIKFSSENDLPIIEADPEQLETILCNLIDNAIRAVNQKGKIEIRSCLIQKIELERHVDFLQVEIEDNGIGIAEDGLKNIFDPYVTGNKDGTGLGLAIVKRIVENHKGFISINSKKNIGTLVTVQLPVKFTGK